MSASHRASPPVALHRERGWDQVLPDLALGMQNLLQHKLRSLLTMLGMIFGVAAVVSMLSIGAGAQQQVMAFIEQLGLRNLIVEAKEAPSWQDLQKMRKLSPGLTFQDFRVIRANVANLAEATPRKRFIPSKMIPKPQREMPTVYGVGTSYQRIANLHLVAGRFYDEEENGRAAPVCVLAQAAKVNLFGSQDALGQYIKVNTQWFRVVGVAGQQLTAGTQTPGLPAQDFNNLIYVPLNAAIFRLEDTYSQFRDEIDGVYLRLKADADVTSAAATVRGILEANHRGADDYTIIVPAELLAEQQRTKRIFDIVMVALASISLLVPMMQDRDAEVRAAACQALGRCREVSAIPALVEHFGRGTPPESVAAAEALGSMPGQSLIALAPYLEEEAKVLPALEILEAARSPLFPDKIVELLDAPQAPVRRAALRVLVNHDEVDAEEHLVRKLQDLDESVRIEAVELLVRNGSTRAVPALAALLVVSDELRYHAIRALGRLRAETAAAQLERLFPRATGHERLEIVAALIRIGAPGLLPFLKSRLKDAEPEVRRVAADGLARVAPASELPLLVHLAQDADWSIRNHAGWGLGRLSLPQGRDALLALVRDTEPVVARTARAALAKLPAA